MPLNLSLSLGFSCSRLWVLAGTTKMAFCPSRAQFLVLIGHITGDTGLEYFLEQFLLDFPSPGTIEPSFWQSKWAQNPFRIVFRVWIAQENVLFGQLKLPSWSLVKSGGSPPSSVLSHHCSVPVCWCSPSSMPGLEFDFRTWFLWRWWGRLWASHPQHSDSVG